MFNDFKENTHFPLAQVDFLVLIDKSGSMSGENKWSDLRRHITYITENVSLHRINGLELCFFNDRTEWVKQVKLASYVNELFEAHVPDGIANTDAALRESFNKHFFRKKQNIDQKTMILLFTDESPDDAQAIIKTLSQISKKLKNNISVNNNLELAISVIQIGNDQKMADFYQSLKDKFHHLISIKGITNI